MWKKVYCSNEVQYLDYFRNYSNMGILSVLKNHEFQVFLSYFSDLVINSFTLSIKTKETDDKHKTVLHIGLETLILNR
jgi:hypothetical protein